MADRRGAGSAAQPASTGKGRSGLFRRWLGYFGVVLLGLSAGRAPAVAQSPDYKPASEAPSAWRDYALLLQGTFQQRLEADEATTRWLAEFAAQRVKETKPLAFVVRTRVAADGKIERIGFDSGVDPELAEKLRPLLASVNAGAPPPDMLQPLHLRLQLRAAE